MTKVSEAEAMREDGWFVIRRGGAFFCPNAQGYTTEIVAAGLYGREEANRYADVEGVTIHPLEDYRERVERTIAEARRVLAALPLPASSERSGGVEREAQAQALQDHMEQYHGVVLSASEWDRAVAAALTPLPDAAIPAEHASVPHSDDAGEVERLALILCNARGEEPEGTQVRFVDGAMHSATFKQIAEHDVRTILAALTARPDTASGDGEAVPAKLLDLAADLECSIVLSCEHQPEKTIRQFAEDSTAFKALKNWLYEHQYADITPKSPASAQGAEERARFVRWINQAIDRADKHKSTEGVWLFADQWRIVLAALTEAGAAREGWKLVPVEPTKAMLRAPRHGVSEDVRAAIWAAMLSASPSDSGGANG